MHLVKWLSMGWSGISTPLFLDLPRGPSSCISHCYTDRKKVQGRQTKHIELNYKQFSKPWSSLLLCKTRGHKMNFHEILTKFTFETGKRHVLLEK